MYTRILVPVDGSPTSDRGLQEAGRVCDLVVAEAKNWEADLIVIGTHGRRGVGRVFMGSDAEQIVRLAASPVLLVRAAQNTELEQVGLGRSGS